MSVSEALGRFEQLIRGSAPELLDRMEPGLDDLGVARLRTALQPMVLPAQVEALYRWRNGGTPGIFGGWSLRPVDELLTWRAICVDDMEEPPAWLQLFDDQCLGFTTLDPPSGLPADQSVWYGHTHDCTVERLFNSIEALVETCADALEAGELIENRGDLRLDGTALCSLEFDSYRLARNPGTYRYPNGAPGTLLSRFPEQDWPRDWLASLGVDADDTTLRGATHTVAALVAAAAHGPAEGTVRGRVVGLSGSGPKVWTATVDDGTGRLSVTPVEGGTAFSPVMSTEFEFDVVLASATAPQYDWGNQDPLVETVMRRMLPTDPHAVAHAVREVPR